MTKFLPVVETFHSLQGEGFHSGKSAFFIRLAGCTVGCSWCDTKQSWNSQRYPLKSIEELSSATQKAIQNGASFLVITGGEPLHHNLHFFCKAIKALNESISIHLETSGVDPLSGSYDWVTLSPKRHHPPKNSFLELCDEVKVIINNEEDITFAKKIKKKILKLYSESKISTTEPLCKKNYYIQPSWNSKNGLNLSIEFAKTNPDWSLSIQTHKYLNLK